MARLESWVLYIKYLIKFHVYVIHNTFIDVSHMSSENATYHIRGLAEEILHDESFHLQGPLSHSGLSFVPIVSSIEPDASMEYINVAEAFELGTLIITEGGDAVNSLIAKNIGDLPVLIEESEVLVASGSQDRIVVASVLIQPGEERRIPVKCVHAPHFLQRGAGFYSIGASGVELRSSLRMNKYCSIMTDVEHYCAETAVDQGEVWEKVQKCCIKLGLEDPTKYTEAVSKIKEKVSDTAKEIRTQLPERTCGVIVIDAAGQIVAIELYRRDQAFKKRLGFLESVLIEFSDSEERPLEREAAWAKAVQLLLQMKDIKHAEVAAKEDTQSIIIGLGNLRGEALLQKTIDEEKNSVLYCSLSQ